MNEFVFLWGQGTQGSGMPENKTGAFWVGFDCWEGGGTKVLSQYNCLFKKAVAVIEPSVCLFQLIFIYFCTVMEIKMH